MYWSAGANATYEKQFITLIYKTLFDENPCSRILAWALHFF